MKKMLLLILVALTVAACSNTQYGAMGGGALGAGTGAIIGHQSGNAGTGALIGAGAGAAGGALLGEQLDKKFCPTCGDRYMGNKAVCPKDGTPLRPIHR